MKKDNYHMLKKAVEKYALNNYNETIFDVDRYYIKGK